MKSLQEYKLGEILDVTRGTTLSGEYYADNGELIRLTLGHFDYVNGGFKTNSSKDNLYFTGPVRDDFILNEGDIITPLTEQTFGLIGSTAIIPESGKYIQSQDVGLVKCKEDKLLPEFCYYLLPTDMVKTQLSAGAQQTSIRHTSPDKIKACKVFIPDTDVQKRIARLLSVIDQKIAVNRAINQNLEAMAKQLYDYWFVQFDFPNEEGKPYKLGGGAMKYSSELNRYIPEGWQVSTLDKLGTFRNGINYSKDEVGDKTYRIVNVRNISSSSLFLDTNDLDEICLVSKSADRYQVGKQDVLIARSGTPGATRIMQNTVDCVIFCGFIICFSVKESNQKCLLTYLLKDLEAITKEQSNGSILSNISQDVLKNLCAVVPPSRILEQFNSRVLPIWSKIDQTISEINTLKKQRDELLPLLMNGQVSVTQLNSDLSAY